MNDERNTKIVRLWNNGYSTGEVAKALGLTKNVVLAAIVKHRTLGNITRPMVKSYSERGQLGNRVKYNPKRQRQIATS